MGIRHLLAAAVGVACLGTTGLGAAAPADAPLQALPYTPSLDTRAMDPSANACEDFYQYACGGWMKNNPIPDDQASWSVYGKAYDDNQRFLWGILDGLAQKTGGVSADQRKLGDYFAACMNEAAVEQRGTAPLHADLARIAALKAKSGLAPLVASLQESTASGGFLFDLSSAQDLGDASQVIASADRGGLGLPDRDYYFRKDAKSTD
ncbi:MAG: M13 family peptidase, partial [Solimonas sp.]